MSIRSTLRSPKPRQTRLSAPGPRTTHARVAAVHGRRALLGSLLRNLSLSISDVCDVSFASFWDVGPQPNANTTEVERAELKLADSALAWYGEDKLFNEDATATLMIASVKSCHGQLVDMLCAGKKDYCQPIMDLATALKAFADSGAYPDGLALEVVA